MSEYDLNNLKFLLSLDKNGIKSWYETISNDDIEYALELLSNYSEELNALEIEYNLKNSMFKEANDILKKFKLKN